MSHLISSSLIFSITHLTVFCHHFVAMKIDFRVTLKRAHIVYFALYIFFSLPDFHVNPIIMMISIRNSQSVCRYIAEMITFLSNTFIVVVTSMIAFKQMMSFSHSDSNHSNNVVHWMEPKMNHHHRMTWMKPTRFL